ncbi:transcriptional regulator [Frankia sp. EI5c]|uniref:GntR family transcriptional regulator n=1 Tax=Frankia sp. EI5c TaxID=683316 RepID=UPI0007C39541|nr:GntR family transcriptional regulator [Frankia sp. EI5c]OAA25361.1 transcriptional regulator [Frankia sp. EI5c]
MADRSAQPAQETPHRQLKDVVYLRLKQEIVDLELLPGYPMREVELAGRLGVSKTPLREALVRLQRERLVELVPYKGAVVSGYDREDLKEIYELRELLEGACAREAAEHISAADLAELTRMVRDSERAWADGDVDSLPELLEAFDRIVYRQTRNRRIREMIENLSDHLIRIGNLTVAIPGRLEGSVRQHSAIHDAITRRDPAAAERLMREHVSSVMADQLAAFDPDDTSAWVGRGARARKSEND